MASLAFRSACFSGDSFFILLPRLLCVLVILLRRFFCSNLLRSRLLLLDCGSLHGDFDPFDHNLLFGFSDVSFDFCSVLDFDLALF